MSLWTRVQHYLYMRRRGFSRSRAWEASGDGEVMGWYYRERALYHAFYRE